MAGVRPFPCAALAFPFIFSLNCLAAVTVQNGALNVSTPDLSMSFQGAAVQTLTNLLTTEKYITQAGPGWFDMDLQTSSGESLAQGSWQLGVDPATSLPEATLIAQDAVRKVTVVVGTDPASNEIFVRLQGTSSAAGVRSLLFGIQGFDPAAGKFLIPAHAGVTFDQNTNPPALSMAYPTHWEAGFAIYDTAQGCVLVYARDPSLNFKGLQAMRQYGTLDMGLQTYAVAPWSDATSVPQVEWRLKTFSGSWRQAVDYYKTWIQTVLPARSMGPNMDWVRSIGAVVTIETPDTSYLSALASKLIPSKTLLYLVNWRNDSFDVNYPDYTPGPTTQAFVEAAHKLGFRIMLHTNAIGVATYNPAYAKVSKYQLRDSDTKDLVYWPWGLWPAGPPPPPIIESFAFISPCSSAYRSLFIAALQPMMAQLKPDALHLDAGGVMLDDGNGLIEGMTSIEGMQKLHEDVIAAFPDVALSYESMTEVVYPFHSFAQRWNADYPAHPVSTYMMGDHVTFYGFLDQPPPDQPGFIAYIDKYEGQGIMPTVAISSLSDINNPPPVAAGFLQIMRAWQDYAFQPDWTGDWTGLDFRFTSADGAHTAKIEDNGTSVQMNIDGRSIYQRAENVQSLATSSFVPSWSAYDGSSLYGLDPTQQYWLQAGLARPSKSVHLASVPDNASMGLGSLSTSKYGYFELNRIPPPPYDFVQQFSGAKIGSDLMRQDAPLVAGAQALISRTVINGQLQDPVLMMIPPYEAPGAAVFVEYQVPIPSTGQTTLTFGAGISDSATSSTGAIFLIRINGQDSWSQQIQLHQLVNGTLDLTSYAGQTIQLRFIVGPPSTNAIEDFGAWTNLALTNTPPATPAAFTIALPSGMRSPSGTSGVSLAPAATGGAYSAQAMLPAAFSIFAAQPPELRFTESLLDLPFDVWTKGYGGWAVPGVISTSGQVNPIVSGGVRKQRALSTIPPANGLTEVTWAVHLPVSASKLNFQFGLADSSPPLPPVIEYSQVGLTIRINGQSLWTQTIQTNGWNDVTLDISKWAGKNVVFELDADGLGQGIYNWAQWAGLTLTGSAPPPQALAK